MKLSVALLAVAIGVVTAEEVAAELFAAVENTEYSYSTLLETFSANGVDAIISANAPVTIFGPWNKAFADIPEVLGALSPEEMTKVLLNHVVVNATFTTEELAKKNCVVATTAGGLNISVSMDPLSGRVEVDGIYVIDTDIIGDYGVFHGISFVLRDTHEFRGCAIAPDFSPIVDLGNYTTLLNSVVKTNNVFTIAYNADFFDTAILGPSDAAFAAIQDTIDGLTDEELSDILRDHMLYGSFLSLSEDLVAFGCVEGVTFGGLEVAIRYNRIAEEASVNGIPMNADFDIVGDYGVFYGIEGVLIEGSSTFVPCSEDPLDFTPVVEAGNYSTILNLTAELGLTDTFALYRPITILAPTDAAFAAIQDTIAGLDEAALVGVLTNHVLNYSVPSEWVTDSECWEAIALEGYPVAFRYDNETGTANVNGIPIVQTDIDGNYGILHGIDGVLGVDGEYVPCNPFSNIEFLLEEYEQEIVAAVIGANALSATLFGPSDAAFEASFADAETELSEEEIQQILLGHLVPNVYTAEDVKEAGCIVLDTLAGTKVRVLWMDGDMMGDHDGNDHGDHDHDDGQNHTTGNMGGRRRRLAGHTSSKGMVMVNDARVILADQVDDETGSILHGIDKVLLPGTFSECPEKSTTVPVAPEPGDGTTFPAPTAAPEESSAYCAAGFGLMVGFIIALLAL